MVERRQEKNEDGRKKINGNALLNPRSSKRPKPAVLDEFDPIRRTKRQ